jgi:hypothetical protein
MSYFPVFVILEGHISIFYSFRMYVSPASNRIPQDYYFDVEYILIIMKYVEFWKDEAFKQEYIFRNEFISIWGRLSQKYIYIFCIHLFKICSNIFARQLNQLNNNLYFINDTIDNIDAPYTIDTIYTVDKSFDDINDDFDQCSKVCKFCLCYFSL